MLGSSPRVWGTRLYAAFQASLQRFIPTGVGNAAGQALTDGEVTVHPHGCGERSQEMAGSLPNAGSSPRVWGTLLADSWEN